MLKRTPTAAARDRETQTGGLHEKFMRVLSLKHGSTYAIYVGDGGAREKERERESERNLSGGL